MTVHPAGLTSGANRPAQLYGLMPREPVSAGALIEMCWRCTWTRAGGRWWCKFVSTSCEAHGLSAVPWSYDRWRLAIGSRN